jgi:hypothetical protein
MCDRNRDAVSYDGSDSGCKKHPSFTLKYFEEAKSLVSTHFLWREKFNLMLFFSSENKFKRLKKLRTFTGIQILRPKARILFKNKKQKLNINFYIEYFGRKMIPCQTRQPI